MTTDEFMDGEGYVLEWKKCLVLVNKQNLPNLISVECTSNVNFGSGRFNLTCSDPNGLEYDIINSGDEIEIYMNTINVANKVWGGYVETKSLATQNGQVLTLGGREYSSRLLNQVSDYTPTAVELSTALKAILANQVDFDDIFITTTSGLSVTFAFTNETLFNQMKKACDQHNFYFGVDVDLHAYSYLLSASATSPDVLLWGSNIFRDNTLEENKEFLVNDITVQASSTVTASASDATSQSQYLKQSKVYTIADVGSTAAAQAYADTLLAVYKDPINQIKVTSNFLPSTMPTDYIQITIPPLGLDGLYQVVEISHRYNRDDGLKTVTTVGKKLTDQSMWLGEMEKRMRLVEQKAYM